MLFVTFSLFAATFARFTEFPLGPWNLVATKNNLKMNGISVNTDGSLWVVDANKDVWYKPGRNASEWTSHGSDVANITSAADHVCVVTFGNRLLCKMKIIGVLQAQWTDILPVEQPTFIDASVNRGGSVWGVQSDGKLYYCPYWVRCATTTSLWMRVDNAPSRVVQVSSKDSLVCVRFKETATGRANKVKCQSGWTPAGQPYGITRDWIPVLGNYGHVSVKNYFSFFTLGGEGSVKYSDNLIRNVIQECSGIDRTTGFTLIESSQDSNYVCGIKQDGNLWCKSPEPSEPRPHPPPPQPHQPPPQPSS